MHNALTRYSSVSTTVNIGEAVLGDGAVKWGDNRNVPTLCTIAVQLCGRNGCVRRQNLRFDMSLL